MWLTTDRPIDEMDTAKLREIVALSDYYPPPVVMGAWEELVKREHVSPVKSPLCPREAESKVKALYDAANRRAREGR